MNLAAPASRLQVALGAPASALNVTGGSASLAISLFGSGQSLTLSGIAPVVVIGSALQPAGPDWTWKVPADPMSATVAADSMVWVVPYDPSNA
jgi:hypothetical protein